MYKTAQVISYKIVAPPFRPLRYAGRDPRFWWAWGKRPGIVHIELFYLRYPRRTALR